MVTLANRGNPAKKILLIGAGQIGSRHLQGLARSRLNLTIEVLEPVAAAREVAMQRFREIPIDEGSKELSAIESLDASSFEGYADLAIIATGAAARYDAIQNTLDRINIPFLLLEKVLFQRISDIDSTEKLLTKKACRAWVNCSRRLFPYSQSLRNVFADDVLSIHAQGGNWGLACNGIHLLDLLAFLSGASIPDAWNLEFLDKKIYESKRGNYREFGGCIGFRLEGGHEIVMKDDKGSNAPLVVDIIGRRARATIIESAGLMLLSSRENQWKLEQIKIHVPYQSALTNLVVDDILIRGSSGLTEYHESARLHRMYLGAFLEHMGKVTGVSHDVCPIT